MHIYNGLRSEINAKHAPGGIVELPAGVFVIEEPIVLPNDGRQITLRGQGRSSTMLRVPETFKGGPGIIHIQGAGEPRPTIERLSIHFDQPDTNKREELIQYPPAIFCQRGGRCILRDLQIVRAWDAIDATAENGGILGDNIEISHFNKGIALNGSFDVNEFRSVRCWVYGLTLKQHEIYKQPETIGFHVGRVDGLMLLNCFTYSGIGYYFYDDPKLGGPAFTTLTSCIADQNTGIVLEGGCVTLVGFSAAFRPSGKNVIWAKKGILNVNGLTVTCGGPIEEDEAVIRVDGAEVMIGGVTRIFSDCHDGRHILQTAGETSLLQAKFNRDPWWFYTQPLVEVRGGRLQMIGCRSNDQGLFSPGVVIENDDWHLLADNTFLGQWQHRLPPAGFLQSRGNAGIEER